jgi:cytochrome c5
MKKIVTGVVSFLVVMLFLVACNKQSDSTSSSESTASQDNQMTRGKEVYTQVCSGCHSSGVAGAPKFGDKEAWAPRISQGMDKLFQSAIHGKGNMPARGGQPGLSDQDIRAAINYMVSNSR